MEKLVVNETVYLVEDIMTNHHFLGEQRTTDPLEIKEISYMNHGKFLWTQLDMEALEGHG
jgi:hypothetical protein